MHEGEPDIWLAMEYLINWILRRYLSMAKYMNQMTIDIFKKLYLMFENKLFYGFFREPFLMIVYVDFFDYILDIEYIPNIDTCFETIFWFDVL